MAPRAARPRRSEDDGFMLIAVIVMVFLVMLALSLAAPRIAMQLKHDRELESQHRAQQYVRAIQVYYLKFKHYPGSVEQLEKTNNQRFLRQKYIDPLTGKDDWRLIMVGQNKTKVKGFFGEDLPGIGGTGIGGDSTTNAGNTTGTSTASASAFNNPGQGGNNSTFGSNSNTPGSSTTGNTSGQNSGSNGIQSQDATSFTGGGGGLIMGVGSSKSGDAFLTVNEQTTYQDWEFLYDPRIEALKAKSTLLGGLPSGSASGSGFGSSTFGSPPGSSSTPNQTPNPSTPNP